MGANGRALTGVRANGYELSLCYLELPQCFQLGLLVVVSLAGEDIMQRFLVFTAGTR
jgi:hypothetical protein